MYVNETTLWNSPGSTRIGGLFKRLLSHLVMPGPAPVLSCQYEGALIIPPVNLFRTNEKEELLPRLTLQDLSRGILNTMNGTLSRKQLERFLDFHRLSGGGKSGKVVFSALVTFCIDDEFIREQVNVEAHILLNTGYVRLCHSKTALKCGFSLAYDTRFNLMKFSGDTLVITSRPGAENEFVIWIRHANMPDPL